MYVSDHLCICVTVCLHASLCMLAWLYVWSFIYLCVCVFVCLCVDLAYLCVWSPLGVLCVCMPLCVYIGVFLDAYLSVSVCPGVASSNASVHWRVRALTLKYTCMQSFGVDLCTYPLCVYTPITDCTNIVFANMRATSQVCNYGRGGANAGGRGDGGMTLQEYRSSYRCSASSCGWWTLLKGSLCCWFSLCNIPIGIFHPVT